MLMLFRLSLELVMRHIHALLFEGPIFQCWKYQQAVAFLPPTHSEMREYPIWSVWADKFSSGSWAVYILDSFLSTGLNTHIYKTVKHSLGRVRNGSGNFNTSDMNIQFQWRERLGDKLWSSGKVSHRARVNLLLCIPRLSDYAEMQSLVGLIYTQQEFRSMLHFMGSSLWVRYMP